MLSVPSASLNSEVSGNERIVSVRGIEILDSRGNPTVEAEVVLTSGVKARAPRRLPVLLSAVVRRWNYGTVIIVTTAKA